MNSMPEPTQTDHRINDSIVQAAMISLAYFRPETPQQAADMLAFWVRRPEMTDADVAEVCERMFPEPLPLMDCPAWCTTDHSQFTYAGTEDLCDHEYEVLVERNEAGSVKLQVLVSVTDELTEQYRNPAGILVITDEPLPADRAVRMIGAVSEGLRILAG